MIIKRYNGSTWDALYPKTITDNIYTGNGATQIFDPATDKIRTQFLPDAVLGGLKFAATIDADATDTDNELLTLIDTQIKTYITDPNPDEVLKSFIGTYWVANASNNASFEIDDITPSTVAPSTSRYYCVIWSNPNEEGTGVISTAKVESGDWIIVTGITGSGLSGTPYVVTLSVVNNTYGIATGSSYGVVKLGYSTTGQNYKVDISSGDLFVNVPWQNDNDNTTYDLSVPESTTAIRLAGNDETNDDITITGTGGTTVTRTSATQLTISSPAQYSHPNHSGDVTSVGDGATTIASGAVTLGKMANLAANSIIGNNTNDAATPVALTAAQVRTLINVADGATANNTDANLLARANHTGTQTAATISDFDTEVANNTAVTANTAKVTNATHTGDVTGSTALTIAEGAVTNSKFRNSAGLSVVGRSANTSGDVADITAATDGHVLRRSGTGLGFGTISSAAIADSAVSNGKLANMAAYRIKANNTSSAAAPTDISSAALKTMADMVSVFYQASAPTAHSDGSSLQTGTLWFDI